MAPGNRNNPKRANNSDATYTIMDFMRQFPDDAACLDYLWRRHYAVASDGEHAQCPKCGEIRKFHRVTSRPSYSCDVCGHHIHPTANTIMHKSSTSLQLWFHALFLMASTRMGISAKQLERELGVTYKTAWRMFTRIRRELMDDAIGPMRGPVEMDETYVGGKPRQSDRAKYAHLSAPEKKSISRAAAWKEKTAVWGVVERGGNLFATVLPAARWSTIAPHVHTYVAPGATVYTDQATLYRWMRGFDHQRVDHGAREYVRGDVHTQTIEGFWSIVKNGIRGTHRHVSAKYLQGYINEYAWRWNRREHGRQLFLALLDRIPVAGV